VAVDSGVSVLKGVTRMAGQTGFEPRCPDHSGWTIDGSRCTFTLEMALAKLRTSYDLTPAMTGWSAFVVAERLAGSLIAANDQQPRGY
jgi:hypothetical protein